MSAAHRLLLPARRARLLASLMLALALLATTATAAATTATAAAPAPADAATPTADPPDAGGPLDLTAVSLVQHDVRMTLRVVTAGAWDSRELATAPDRELCVSLVHGDPAVARGRICVVRRAGRTGMDITPLADDGSALTARPLAADISRPSASVLEATFLPAAAGLSPGPLSWYVDSAWSDAKVCPATCRDRVPDSGSIDGEVVLLAVAPCFGAAARDPAAPCQNPDLARSVEPTPARAKVILDPLCDKVQHDGLITACSFGAPAEEAVDTFALIGDSHAANLKSALIVLTHAKQWRGVSILRSGCTTTRGRPILGTSAVSRDCRTWNSQVLRWLAKHPEVRTVFLSAHASARVVATGGRTPAQAAEAGYREELLALLRQKRRVVVIRDAPASNVNQLGCVSRALSAGRNLQTACTFARRTAVPRDPLLEAARALRSPSIRTIDLTRQYCNATRCFSVVGGALVRHDQAHLTQAFAVTLGPFVLRALDA
jgi:hypothetical protein